MKGWTIKLLEENFSEYIHNLEKAQNYTGFKKAKDKGKIKIMTNVIMSKLRTSGHLKTLLIECNYMPQCGRRYIAVLMFYKRPYPENRKIIIYSPIKGRQALKKWVQF